MEGSADESRWASSAAHGTDPPSAQRDFVTGRRDVMFLGTSSMGAATAVRTDEVFG